MKKIKIAQIGTGHDHASDVITTLKKQSDKFEVVGFATVPEDDFNTHEYRFENRKDKFSDVPRLMVEEILNYPELDAVCIETEDRALTKYALMAAEKGFHIHMDKPGSADFEEYKKLVDIMKKNNKVFHVGYMYRYNPAIMKLKDDIMKGKLGEIYSVEAQMNCCHSTEKRNWLGNFPGGMLYFLGCHMIDFVYSVIGEPDKIIPLSTSSAKDGTTSDDFGMAVFKYKNGVSFVKSSGVERDGFERRQIVVSGSKGTVEICPIEQGEISENIFVPLSTTVRESIDGCEKKVYKTEVFGRYDKMIFSFAEYVRGDKTNPFGYDYEKKLHKILLQSCEVI